MNAAEPDLCCGVACDRGGLVSAPVSPSGPVFPRALPCLSLDKWICEEMSLVSFQHVCKR